MHAKLCPTLCNAVNRSLPGSSVHGVLQARILPSSRGSSSPRDRTCISYVSCTGRRVLYHQCHLGSPRKVTTRLRNTDSGQYHHLCRAKVHTRTAGNVWINSPCLWTSGGATSWLLLVQVSAKQTCPDPADSCSCPPTLPPDLSSLRSVRH